MDEQPLKDEEESRIREESLAKPSPASVISEREEALLSFWKEKKIFEKTLSKEAPKGEFVFYDGPPFATGLPHYGHILPNTIKDVIPRYKTMQGYRVPRRWGWDCHGLPLENLIEKELGIKTKRDIEELGVGKFNDAARNAVLRYADDWKRIIPRFGRFVDMDNDYRTMDASYTESVWWAFKSLHDKGLIYEGFKPMHLCPRCGTTLSNFEVAQGYKDITDLAVTVKLRLTKEPETSLLAWTTTPWTLPGNMAAAVNEEETYVKIVAGGEKYILAKDRLAVIQEPYTIEKEMKGGDLVGMSYEPPFPYFKDFKIEGKEKAWKVYAAPYVTMEDGTGLVHLAPAFGAEDLELAQKVGIPILHHVDKDGFFVEAVTDFKGMQAKPKEDPQSTDVAIIKYLAANKLLFAKEKITHSYPHCWRCDTPLLNYAASSWFVEVTSFKDKLVSENKKIAWVPKEVGEKRFGNWLENARDWAISRARYWGAPIPVWRNTKTKRNIVIGSVAELKKYAKRSGNRYFIIRHGEAEHNVAGVISCNVQDGVHLTEKGKMMVGEGAKKLSGKKIDLLAVSPFLRTIETAKIVAHTLGIPESAIVIDERLREYDHGIFDGRSPAELRKAHSTRSLFEVPPKNGETFLQLSHRVGEAVYDLEKKYEGKNILIVSHGWPLAIIKSISEGANRDKAAAYLEDQSEKEALIPVGSPVELDFVPLPHNEDFELDLHRPYIDEIKLEEAGQQLERVKDVFDCWFESGSMSYAQNHYPFANKDIFEPKPGFFGKSRGYPADFIAEGLDQTRGWFYSLLVLGVALFGRASYKNVIVSGIVLAEDGQKMSKRLNNYPDPITVLEKYGADAIRYYLIASPLMRGEDLNFSEKGVAEIASKLVGRLTNVLTFYELYKDAPHAQAPSGNILDRWILSRLSETIREVEAGMESYELDKASRPLMAFIEDLSTWYVRRSRERFKEESADSAAALETTRFVLETFSKVAAPFMPFVAEYVFEKVKNSSEPESVHLALWPRGAKADDTIIADMKKVRQLASAGLEARQKATIKVRQPLAMLAVPGVLSEELKLILADEVNVKVIQDGAGEVSLDTTMTAALKEEGEIRETIRFIQDLRKKAGLTSKDPATLIFSGSPEGKQYLLRNWSEIVATAKLSALEEGPASAALSLSELSFSLDVRKT